MEFEFIDWLRKRLPDHPRLVLAPGDAAAILNLGRDSDCVVTSDLLTDEVDFGLRETDASRIGHKALAVNLSDLAAMAAEPVAALVSLALPRDGALALAKQLYQGLLPLAEEFQLSVAGGDTNCWNGPLALSITAIGRVTSRGPLRRNKARPGDELIVTGCLGGSILGKHLDFNPRVNEALSLNQQYDIHAAIDISDGLSLDISRLVSESGCGAEIQLEQIPVPEPARQLAQMKNNGRTHWTMHYQTGRILNSSWQFPGTRPHGSCRSNHWRYPSHALARVPTTGACGPLTTTATVLHFRPGVSNMEFDDPKASHIQRLILFGGGKTI